MVPEICVEADRQTDRHTHAHHNTPLPTADGVEYRAGMVEAGGEVEMDVCVCVCVRERERERERPECMQRRMQRLDGQGERESDQCHRRVATQAERRSPQNSPTFNSQIIHCTVMYPPCTVVTTPTLRHIVHFHEEL